MLIICRDVTCFAVVGGGWHSDERTPVVYRLSFSSELLVLFVTPWLTLIGSLVRNHAHGASQCIGYQMTACLWSLGIVAFALFSAYLYARCAPRSVDSWTSACCPCLASSSTTPAATSTSAGSAGAAAASTTSSRSHRSSYGVHNEVDPASGLSVARPITISMRQSSERSSLLSPLPPTN